MSNAARTYLAMDGQPSDDLSNVESAMECWLLSSVHRQSALTLSHTTFSPKLYYSSGEKPCNVDLKLHIFLWRKLTFKYYSGKCFIYCTYSASHNGLQSLNCVETWNRIDIRYIVLSVSTYLY